MTGLSARFLVNAGNGGHANGVRPHASALGPDGLPGLSAPSAHLPSSPGSLSFSGFSNEFSSV